MKSSDAYDTNNDDRPIEIADGFFIPFLRNADRYDGHRRITRVNNDAPLTSRFPYLTTAGDRLSKYRSGGGERKILFGSRRPGPLGTRVHVRRQ